MALIAFRTFFIFVSGLLGWSAAVVLGQAGWAGFAGGAVVGGVVTTLEALAASKKFLSGFLIAVIGILAGFALSRLIIKSVAVLIPDYVGAPTVEVLNISLMWSICYITVAFLFRTKDEIKFLIPYLELERRDKGGRSLILDTSVIIDGRIADIAETGFLESKVIVPKFVLDELQAIADAPDRLKRNRGRRGLDMLNRLRQNPRLEIVIHEGLYDDHESVDGRLVKLAKQTGGRIVTNDFNLNKVARLQGVDVMNINDLANALKTVHLPGEEMILKIIKPGEEAGQGIGYLDDGTMVVVDHGRESIGREIPIIVTSVIQTSAGRMVFARMKQG